MEARARAKYIREAPRKTRLVIDLIRGKNAAEAAVILQFTPREAARTVLKVLNSAVANAVNKGAAGAEGLTVSEAFVDEGPTLKRFRPRAQGRASRINKRSSHITIVVSGAEAKPKAAKKPGKAADAAAASKPAASKAKATGDKNVKTESKKTTTKAKDAKKSAPKKGEIASSSEKQTSRNDASRDNAINKEEKSGSEG